MINKYIYLLIAILVFAFFCNSVFAKDLNLNEAIQHAKTAAEASNGKAIAEYAVVAKEHANAAKESIKKSSSPGAGDNDLDSAIKYLEQAIEKGNADDTQSARDAVENAVIFLKKFE